jgi:hypothetical protein
VHVRNNDVVDIARSHVEASKKLERVVLLVTVRRNATSPIDPTIDQNRALSVANERER